METNKRVNVLSVPNVLPRQGRGEEDVAATVAMSAIKRADLLHLLLRQLKIKDVLVGIDASRLRGLGNADRSALNRPADHHLRTGLVMVLGDLQQHGVLHQWHRRRRVHVARASQRVVGSHRDSVLLAVLQKLPLLQMGMQLHLVHRGLDGAEGQQVRQLLRREVGNTDRVNQTLRITHSPQPYSLHELFHLRPRALQVLHVVAETILGIIRGKANVVVKVTLVSLLVLLLRQIQESRPVDQIQVKVLQLELLQVLLQRALHILRLPVRNPQLRRHPEILSLHNALVNALLDGSANSGLIAVKTLRCTDGRRQ